jgi:hypothetical protein
VLLRLLSCRQLESGGCGLDGGAHPLALMRAGNSRSGLVGLGWEATVNVYGVAVAMPQGYSRVPNPSTEQQ